MEAKQLRAQARASLANTWAAAIGVAAVAFLLGGIGNTFLPNIELGWTEEIVLFEGTQGIKISIPQGIPGILALILGGVLELGYTQFMLKQHDRRAPEFSDLFSEFHRFGTGFAQAFLRGLYVFLWSLLLIVPGIVKSYSYAMTPYILAENPDMTASEAITRSQEMMDGHKGELCILHLTFIGWSILAGLCWNLGYLVLNPYKKAAETAFYRQLTANSQ